MIAWWLAAKRKVRTRPDSLCFRIQVAGNTRRRRKSIEVRAETSAVKANEFPLIW